MSNVTMLSPEGLNVSNNTFTGSPPGSLLVANNAIINQKGVVEQRNGQENQATLSNDYGFGMTDFQGHTIVNKTVDSTKIANNYTLGYEASGTIHDYTGPFSGQFIPVDCDGANTAYGRMKFALANNYLHFCTAAGPLVLEKFDASGTSPGGDPRIAGLSWMPDNSGHAINGIVDGWMPYNSSVAYRSVLRRNTTNNVSLLSPPSNRVIITNRILVPIGGLVRTSGTTVTATLPASQDPGLSISSTFVLSPGEANFAAGTYTITGISGPKNNVFTYASSGSNVASTVIQDVNPTLIRDVQLKVVLPANAVAGDFLRLYRSIYTAISTTVPDDDMFLANEVLITSGNITAGFITIVDFTPQSILYDPLYTNPTLGASATAANFQPPLYRDIASWDTTMWYANTTGQHMLQVQLLGVGSPAGVQNNDTITIVDGTLSPVTTTFTFKTSPTLTNDVQIVSDGLPSYNITQTVNNFIAKATTILKPLGIGVYGTTTLSGFAGAFIIQRYNWGPQLTVSVSRPTSWTPSMASSSPAMSDSSNQPNQLQYATQGEAESVPPTNYLSVGSRNYNISRIFGLRNALIICKEGDGIYALTGTSGNYLLRQISIANIIAPDAACVFADQVWVYTDQGIMRVSDSGGCEVESRAIETVLRKFQATFPIETFNYAFAVPYEVERRVMFFIPVGIDPVLESPIMAAYAFSYPAVDAWTFLDQWAYGGVVTAERHLWLSQYEPKYPTADNSWLTRERKDVTVYDKADFSWAANITAVIANPGGPDIIELDTSAAEAGDGITQGIWQTKIVAHRTDLGLFHYEVAEQIPWALAACTLYKAFLFQVQFQPFGESWDRKSLTRLAYLFKPGEYSSLFGQISILTNDVQSETYVDMPSPGYGLQAFGSFPFGSPTLQEIDCNPIPQQVQIAAQHFLGFKLNEVWARFKLQGIGAVIDTATGPAGRGR